MDTAAPPPGFAPGLVRLLEDCEALARLTRGDRERARGRLDAALGHELAGRLVGALTRRVGRAPLPV